MDSIDLRINRLLTLLETASDPGELEFLKAKIAYFEERRQA